MAMARPIPRLPPVTIATRPCKLISCTSSVAEPGDQPVLAGPAARPARPGPKQTGLMRPVAGAELSAVFRCLAEDSAHQDWCLWAIQPGPMTANGVPDLFESVGDRPSWARPSASPRAR